MNSRRHRFIALLTALLLAATGTWICLVSPPPPVARQVVAQGQRATASQRSTQPVPPLREVRKQRPGAPLPAGLDGNTPARLLFGSAWGHEPRPELQAFDDWAKRYLAASPADRARLLPEGLALLAQRMAVLQELIKTDPRQAIASTVPMTVRAQLPADIEAQLEQRVAGAGKLSLLGVMASPGGTVPEPTFRSAFVDGQEYRAYVYGRRTDQATKVDISIAGVAVGGALAVSESPLRVLDPGEVPPAQARIVPICPISGAATPTAANAPQNTTLSNVVEVGGVIYHLCHLVHVAAFEQQLINAEDAAGPYPGALSSVLTAADGQPGTSGVVGRPPLAWSTGTKKVIVIRVDFSDLPGAPTYPGSPSTVIDPAYVVNVFTQTNGINDYYSQASYGQAALSISTSDVTGVLRMPHTAAYYAQGGLNDTLHTDAEAAATSAGFNLANYDRLGVVFANLHNISGSQINYGGLGDIQGNQFWINGYFDFRDCAHEIGHTFGLQHCNLWQVSDGNPVSPNGSSTEYGDPFGVMGQASSDIRYHFDMWEKSILHWIPDTSVTTVSASGTYRVYRFDHASASTANTLALKIVRNSTQDYWIGMRQLFTTNTSLMNGAYILWGYNTVVQGNLLDMTTPGSSAQDAALAVGATFHDTVAGVTLTTLDKGGTTPNEYLDVQVGLDPRIQWQSSVFSVDEQLGSATLTLTRSSNSTGAVSVNYATSDGTATTPANYATQSGSVSWASGDSAAKTVSIPIVTTAAFTGMKAFTVTLSGISGGVIGNSPVATVNIASAGANDPGFTSDFVDNTLLQTLVQPDGKVLVAGWLTSMQDSGFVDYTRNGFGRLNANGTVDTGFGNGSGVDSVAAASPVPVYAMALQPDGRVLIGGNFAKVHGVARNSIARLNSDGSLDTSFDPGVGPNDTVSTIQIQPDGRILIGGAFTSVAGTARVYIARLNADGTLDTSFVGPSFGGTGGWQVYALALQPDGKILVGGTFYFSGGPFAGSKFRSGMIRVTSSGGVDTSFDTGDGAHLTGNTSNLSIVRSISLQRDGSVVMGGDFTGFGGATHNHLARVSSTGAVDSTFNPSADDTVYTTLLQGDGKVLAGGGFGHLNSAVRNSFGRINGDGSLDTIFGSGTGSTRYVYDFAMQADGKVILCGDYATIQGVANVTVARLFTGLPGLPGSVQFSAPTYTGGEGSSLSVTATRQGGSYGAVSINYGTQAGTAASTRYTPVSGTLSWADGDAASKTFTVPLVNDGIIEPDQTFSLNLGIPVGAVIPGSPGTATVTVTTSTPPYVQWQNSKFSPSDLLDPSISGDLADPDHDGIPNLLEYAFGFDPKIANSTPYQTVAIQSVNGTNYLTLSFRYVPTATDLTYNPQCGPSMTSWSSALMQVGSPVTNGDGTQTLTYRDNVPTSQAAQRFMRLLVTRSP